MADIFVSYKKDDRALAEGAVDALQQAGFSVWWDDRITPTEHWDRMIEREIDAAKAVLVIWTPRSVESDWVRIEANFAAEHAKLVQLRFGGCRPPLAYSMLQRVDLDEKSGFTGREWEKALGWIALLSGRSEAPGEAPPQSESPEATPEFFNSMFGFSNDVSNDGDLHIPGTLTIAQSIAGCSYEIEPVPGAAEQQTYRIEIPPGVFNGTKMRLAGRGARRKDGGIGDLYLVIAVHDSGPFRLEGRTLHLDLPLSPAEAAAGSDREIRLPGGRVLRTSIPAGVGDGMIVRLSGCGLPSRGVHPAGDVMLHVKVG